MEPRHDAVWLRAPAGTPVKAALAAVFGEMFYMGDVDGELTPPQDHAQSCGGIWCIRTDAVVCGRCGLGCTTVEAWVLVDEDAAAQFAWPDGPPPSSAIIDIP